jgi:hypothetical protein
MIAALSMTPLALHDLAAPARADTATILFDGKLPHAVFAQATVWTGTRAHLFGGAEMACYCELDEIVEYDPVAKQAVRLSARLPEPRAWATAVWDGSRAHVFAGDGIVHFDPATGAVTRTPTSVYFSGTSAVWAGGSAYVFAGRANAGGRVYRYDPATDALTAMAATLPAKTAGASAVWTGTYAYLLGGADWSSSSDRILRYDPVADTVTTLSARLPQGRSSAGAVWTGAAASVFGGMCALCAPTGAPPVSTDPLMAAAIAESAILQSDDIVRFTPGAKLLPST